MPNIGFRFAPCTHPSLEVFPGLQIVFFGTTSDGHDVSAPGAAGWITVSTAVLNSEVEATRRATFVAMIRMIALARLEGFHPDKVEASIDDATHPKINTAGLVSQIDQSFESLAAFHQFMGETWNILAPKPDDQSDAHDPNYKDPFSP